jgi:hypothetical protein
MSPRNTTVLSKELERMAEDMARINIPHTVEHESLIRAQEPGSSKYRLWPALPESSDDSQAGCRSHGGSYTSRQRDPIIDVSARYIQNETRRDSEDTDMYT